MIQISILCILLLPQFVAGHRQASPAVHLTLLLLALCVVTTFLVVMTFSPLPKVAPASVAEAPHSVIRISTMGIAVLGLTLLTPLYWAIEQLRPNARLDVDVVLAQTFALTLTAALVTKAGATPDITIATVGARLTAGAALLLILALCVRVIWQFTRPKDI